jgi:hypothetical protein
MTIISFLAENPQYLQTMEGAAGMSAAEKEVDG